MRTVAILPIKRLDAAKQRLSEHLASGSRQSLMQAMLSDVLAALRRSRGLDAIVVVTDDPLAESIAIGDRVTLVRDSAQSGQSPAAEIGVRHALAAGFERALLVPADAPLLDPGEVDELLERCALDRIAVAIVPDRHGTGTNALLLSPPDAIRPAFGPDSLPRHVGLARGAGLSHRIEDVPSLSLDVDTGDDLAALGAMLQHRRTGAPRTRGALRQLGRAGRVPAPSETPA